MSLLNVFGIAGSAMTAQSVRLNTTASNLANVESVVDEKGQPYRGKQVVFQVKPVQGEFAKGVRVKEIVESAAPFRLVYDPYNPAADARGYVRMPNVNVVEEMVNMISASRSYQNNVEVLNSARDLLRKTLAIGQ
ncbi:MAG: flagellar basal body rod protein FlgC [Hydrogenophilus sp.]|nr:flagellar basal body rod protein FlgC [Hydrogenophilus sp.]